MTTVRILPTRTHRLGGERVEAGVPVGVPAAHAELALRHGWAVLAVDDKARPKAKAKPDPAPEAPQD